MHWVDCSTICRPPQLMRTICLSFGFLWLSFAGMAVSGHIWGVLLCTVLRSAGAAIIWVYSTLLLQLVVPNALLGRMMALELAFNTVCPGAPGTRRSCTALPGPPSARLLVQWFILREPVQAGRGATCCSAGRTCPNTHDLSPAALRLPCRLLRTAADSAAGAGL